jgi:hypothetical protein
MRRARPSPLRSELDALLALALSLPALGAAACSAPRDKAPPPDASVSSPDAPLDASCTPYEVDAAAFEDSGCGRFLYLPCGVPFFSGDSNDAAVGPLCNPPIELCTTYCPQEFTFVCQLATVSCVNGAVIPDAALYLDCSHCLGNIGRRPRGLRRLRSRTPVPTAGRYLALAAHLEAASVAAFRDLAAELERFGAPLPLRRAAHRAARDEERHARVVTGLARRHGAVPNSPRRRTPPPPESLGRFLARNAVEGCVRETYGAFVAHHQALRAEEPAVARALARIAEDETRHAELAWAIHGWGLSSLAPRARVHLAKAQEKALAELAKSAGVWPSEVTRALGLPARHAEPRLLAEFAAAVARLRCAASTSCRVVSADSRATTS